MAKGKKVKQQEDNVVLTGDDPQRLAKKQKARAPKTPSEADAAPAGPGQDELKDLKEQVLRTRADFENFKRRTEEQQAEVAGLARAEMALAILPVIDNLDLAAKHVPSEVSKSDWYQGFAAIQKQFDQVLESLGIARIESVGEVFDPNRHEAVSHEPSDDYDKDVVSEEFAGGFTLGDSVIRPSKVRVSSGKPDEASIPGEDPGSPDDKNDNQRKEKS